MTPPKTKSVLPGGDPDAVAALIGLAMENAIGPLVEHIAALKRENAALRDRVALVEAAVGSKVRA